MIARKIDGGKKALFGWSTLNEWPAPTLVGDSVARLAVESRKFDWPNFCLIPDPA